MEFEDSGMTNDNANSSFCFLSALEPLCDSGFGVLDDLLTGCRMGGEKTKDDFSNHSESSEYASMSPVSDNSVDFVSYTHSNGHRNQHIWNTEYGFTDIPQNQSTVFPEEFHNISSKFPCNGDSQAHHSQFSDQDTETFNSICATLNNNIQEKPKRKRVQSPRQRQAANVRERKRMFYLNDAFELLRKRLPTFKHERTISRIQVLRLAAKYISFMKDCLNENKSKDILGLSTISKRSSSSSRDRVN